MKRKESVLAKVVTELIEDDKEEDQFSEGEVKGVVQEGRCGEVIHEQE